MRQLLKTVAGVACFSLLACFSARTQIVLNEVCSDTDGANLSPGGTTADYIELFNAGTSAVDLSGWGLTDDVKVPNKYVLPAGTSLAADSNLVVWLDSAATYPGLVCTNFSLKASGEAVGLFQGTVRKDYLKFGPQVAGTALCRVPDGTGAWALGTMTPGKANQALATTAFGTPAALRLNEWLADNSSGSDWLEVYNPKTNGVVALGGLVISDQTGTVTTPAIIPNSFIAAGGFVKFVCDGSTNQGDHLDIKLSSTFGETLTIYAANRLTILDRVVFGTQATDVSMGRIPDGGTNFITFAGTNYMTPGAPNAYRPLTNIVINEILAHTDPPLEDAIEVYNPTTAAVDVGGWWLSNDPDTPYKFRIPAGTMIPAGRYLVFYEQNQFNGYSSAPGFNRSGTGVAPDFTFNSAHGDTAVLNQALANGALTGVRVTKGFGASANGVSFGRYVKSDGGVDYVAMAARTFGADTPFTVAEFRTGTGLANSYPLVGPLVISEIHYQPPPVMSAGVTNDGSIDEFIELTSLSGAPLALYDPAFPTNRWRLRGGIDYEFPKDTMVPANAHILVVNFSPKNDQAQLVSFRTKYNVPSDVTLFGPYNGKLNNSGDTVQLEKPDPVQLPPHPDAGFVPFVLVDKVKYDVANGWPTNASGTGCSIQRLDLSGYGNDQINWFGAAPTAGRANTASAVTLLRPAVDSSGFGFSFTSELARSYKVEFRTGLAQGTWQTLTNLTGTGAPLTVRDPGLKTSARFYRVTAQ